MFEILYRITDKTEYLKTLDERSFDSGGDIEGFFAINVNGNFYGHYHSNPLGDDEAGWHLISEWFLSLVLVDQNLNHSDYVALNDIESFNTWIEFKKDHDDLVSVSVIENNKEDGVAEIHLIPFEEFNYGEWHNELIKQREFHDELINKIRLFMSEIEDINVKLLNSKNISKLSIFLSS